MNECPVVVYWRRPSGGAPMRGNQDPQSGLFSYVAPDHRVPADHPLRILKAVADDALKMLSPTFTAMYSPMGRPSIPPERLLKAQLLIALYSVRGHRLFCEQLDYNILFRWFLDMSLDEPSFDASTFSQNQERLLQHAVAQKFFDAVVGMARSEDLLSDEHFSVDGTLIEAWASLKSVQPTVTPPQRPPPQHDRLRGPLGPQGEGQGSQAVVWRPRPDGESPRPVRRPVCDLGHGNHGTQGGERPAPAPSPPRRAAHDRGRGQGLPHHGVRPVFAAPPDSAACCSDQGPSHARLGRAHHPAHGLPNQSAHSKTDRRDLWLGQDDRGLAEDALSGDQADAASLPLGGQCL